MNPNSLAVEIIFGLIRPETMLDWKEGYDLLYPDDFARKNTPKGYLEASHEHKKLRDHGDEEKEATFILATQTMAKPLETAKGPEPLQGMFRTLLHVIDAYLQENDGNAVIRNQKLLPWRMLSTQIGQDLPICGFLAWKDGLMNRERLEFTWPLHLPSDNSALKAILQKGMAENHYHLWGSVPSFHLIWLRLMGDAGKHDAVLGEVVKAQLFHDAVAVPKAQPWPLQSLTRLAGAIRLYLYSRFNDAISGPGDAKCDSLRMQIYKLLESDDPSEQALSALESQINVVTESFWNESGMGYAFDYALPKALHKYNKNDGMLLAFERYFLYTVWRKLLAGKFQKEEGHWFHIYLLIKAKVRREYVQVNDRVGFHNFKNYQDRKDAHSNNAVGKMVNFFSFWSTRLAITRPLSEMPIQMLEARIAPPKNATPFEFEKRIRQIVEAAQTNLWKYLKNGEIKHIKLRRKPKKMRVADHLYFVVHFLKRPDNKAFQFGSCRHWDLRQQLAKQAYCLSEFEASGSSWAGYIRGIDAASEELICRPEVFAHAFRFLRRNHPMQGRLLAPERKQVPKQLRVTYHVGEDFLCIVDGLRAIEETILYLDYQRGDRLGHALALGVDPRDWYNAKHHSVMLARQDFVDNLAWMHSRLVEIGDHAHLGLIAKLERDWKGQFREMVECMSDSDFIRDITIHDYFEAWKLRGDDPECYSSGGFESHRLLQPWEQSAILTSKGDDFVALRQSPVISKIYHYYHFSKDWKKAGAEMIKYDITNTFIAGAICLQKYIQQLVVQKGIGIESNPSSNYLIGTFRRYDKHPLPTLHNLGLTYDPKELAECPQLSISINTDDLGIFDTSLENEFALMANALERMKNEDGTAKYSPAMILDWIDRVRAMGIQQSFRRIEP